MISACMQDNIHINIALAETCAVTQHDAVYMSTQLSPRQAELAHGSVPALCWTGNIAVHCRPSAYQQRIRLKAVRQIC